MFETLPTISISIAIVKIVFYLIVGLFTIGSAMALYSLIRYGKGRFVITAVSVTYVVISLTLYLIAVGQLNSINFQ
jgi:hypothetical protein